MSCTCRYSLATSRSLQNCWDLNTFAPIRSTGPMKKSWRQVRSPWPSQRFVFCTEYAQKKLVRRRRPPGSQSAPDIADRAQPGRSDSVSQEYSDQKVSRDLDHLLRRRLAGLRGRCSYAPCDRQQAHGLTSRSRQGKKGSLRNALAEAVRNSA
jgi:hypothetical protein